MLTSEVLYEAANLIEFRGWSRGDGWKNQAADHPVCVEGAIAAAMGEVGGPGYRCPAYDAVREYIGGKLLWEWNDHLIFQQDEHGHPTYTGWLGGGSQQEATELGREVVLATLRAAAVIEAAKEAAPARESVSS
jgi:hypothetical protein